MIIVTLISLIITLTIITITITLIINNCYYPVGVASGLEPSQSCGPSIQCSAIVSNQSCSNNNSSDPKE